MIVSNNKKIKYTLYLVFINRIPINIITLTLLKHDPTHFHLVKYT